MDERLVELLGVYGLTEREARIFVYLSKNGATGAGELAKGLEIRRMEAYRLLKRLTDRGIVASTAGKPIKYQAESIEGILSLLTDEQRGFVRRMDDAKAEVMQLWRQLPRAPKENFEQRFRIIQGREQIYSTMMKMLESASASVQMVLTKNDVAQAYVLGMSDRVKELNKRGVRARMVTVVDPSALEAAEAFARALELRHSDEASRSRLVLVDGVESLVSLVLDDSTGAKNERDVAIWTDSKDYAELMAAMYRVSFERAKETAEMLDSMKSRLKFEGKVSSIVGAVRSAVEDEGWSISTPGKIAGVSGSEYEFAAVLAGPDEKRVAVEVVFGYKDKPVGEQVTASIVKKLDLEDATLLILSAPMPDEQTSGLARLMGVALIDATDPLGAASAVRESLR